MLTTFKYIRTNEDIRRHIYRQAVTNGTVVALAGVAYRVANIRSSRSGIFQHAYEATLAQLGVAKDFPAAVAVENHTKHWD